MSQHQTADYQEKQVCNRQTDIVVTFLRIAGPKFTM